MASTHRGTGRTAGNSHKIVIPSGVKNSLLESLAAEIKGGTILDTPPKGGVSAEMLSQTSGVGLQQANSILRTKERAGDLVKYRVRVPGYRNPQAFWVKSRNRVEVQTPL